MFKEVWGSSCIIKGGCGPSKMIFDGTMMFTTARLTQDDKPMNLTSQRNDGVAVEVTIKLVGEIQPTDYHYMQFFNIVLRQVQTFYIPRIIVFQKFTKSVI